MVYLYFTCCISKNNLFIKDQLKAIGMSIPVNEIILSPIRDYLRKHSFPIISWMIIALSGVIFFMQSAFFQNGLVFFWKAAH